MSIENIANEAFEIAPDTDIPEATPYDKTLAVFSPSHWTTGIDLNGLASN